MLGFVLFYFFWFNLIAAFVSTSAILLYFYMMLNSWQAVELSCLQTDAHPHWPRNAGMSLYRLRLFSLVLLLSMSSHVSTSHMLHYFHLVLQGDVEKQTLKVRFWSRVFTCLTVPVNSYHILILKKKKTNKIQNKSPPRLFTASSSSLLWN